MKQSGLIASAALGCVVLAVVSACGGGTGTGGSGGTGVTTTSKSSTSGVTGATTTTTGAGPTSSTATGAGGGCAAPTILHPPMGAPNTVYCPFSGTPNISCDPATTHCCEPKMGTATCDPLATPCPAMAMDWQCQDPVADCPTTAKPVCCAKGATFGMGAPGCSNFAHTMSKTECTAAAGCNPATDLILCSDSSECAMGKTCTPFKKAGAGVGACQ